MLAKILAIGGNARRHDRSRFATGTVRLARGLFCCLAAMAFTGCVGKSGEVSSENRGPNMWEAEQRSVRERRIALTFDAGGGIDGLGQLIDALRSDNTSCTFFLTGEWASKYPRAAREIISEGHEIGNHTWSHCDLTLQDDERVRSEILRADTLLTNLCGRSPRPLFRAPYGARNSRVLNIAGGLGYSSIYWTLDSLDSVDPPKSPEFLVNRVTSGTDRILDGHIVLMHVGEPSTARAAPAILRNLRSRGFEMVKVSALVRERLPVPESGLASEYSDSSKRNHAPRGFDSINETQFAAAALP